MIDAWTFCLVDAKVRNITPTEASTVSQEVTEVDHQPTDGESCTAPKEVREEEDHMHNDGFNHQEKPTNEEGCDVSQENGGGENITGKRSNEEARLEDTLGDVVKPKHIKRPLTRSRKYV